MVRQDHNSTRFSILDPAELCLSEADDYRNTLVLLAKEMNVDLGKKRDRNAGEVLSMALAWSKNYQFFISDDRGARVAANKHLQNLDGSCFQTLNMADIVNHVRDNADRLGLSRKLVKQLYLYSSNPSLGRDRDEKIKLDRIHAKMREHFDRVLWPTDKG